jgi:ATP-dependent Clp protease protease subunit
MAVGYVATSLPRRPASYLVPPVIEQTSRGERSFDLYMGLLLDRVVFLSPEIDDTKAHLIIGRPIQLDSQDPDPEIKLYINSPGGSVTVGLGIHDTRY